MSIKLAIKKVLTERPNDDQPMQKRLLGHQIQPLLKKAVVITGVRRSGKSTLLRQLYQEWKIPQDRLLSINFSDERLSQLRPENLDLLIECHIELGGSKGSSAHPLYVVLDEIQLITGWEKFVDRMIRNSNYRLFLTGSSSRLLSQDIATEMRGRSLRFELFPFSFSEYLILNGVEAVSSSDTSQRALQRKYLYSYLTQGGFPEPLIEFKEYSTRILQEYLNTIFYKDVMERKNLSSPLAAKHVLTEFCNQVGSLFTINKTWNRLSSLGYRVQKSFVSEILDGLHDAYAFFPVTIDSKSIAKRNTNPKKLYIIDTGLLNALRSSQEKNSGHLLENLIFLYLRQHGKEVNYYKTKSGYEVDFIVRDSQLTLIQVCENISQKETLDREVRALNEALKENPTAKALLLTMDSQLPKLDSNSKIEIQEVIDFLISPLQI